MPQKSSLTPSAIRSGRVAPVNDLSSAREKLGPTRDRPPHDLQVAEPGKIVLATGRILPTRYDTLKPAAVRAGGNHDQRPARSRRGGKPGACSGRRPAGQEAG